VEKRVLKYKIRRFKFLSILTLVISSSAFAVDTDGDGYDDAVDFFPGDPLEWIDTDRDGIGNNSDNDIDGDGLINSVDNNDDGDLAIDIYDPLPKDPSEWLDTDNDGLGNNTDTDDDNDGVPDLLDVFPLNLQESLDSDLDGIGNNADADDDGDGVLDVYDQFPLDPLETIDTDLDGIGNNADIDDDGDGVNDGSDAFPLDFNVNADLDGDGMGNAQDPDIDNDGIENTLDVFPYDNTEWYDTDGDGIGNNTDTDDDTHDVTGVGDGVLDVNDDMPLDPLETLDTDNDGIGNNADDDDDGDGVQDSIDIFPLDSTEHLDLDTDGIGDNSDPDIDGDGALNTNDAFPFLASEQKDTDGDGLGDKSDNDIDGDGVTNGPFTSGNYADPSDTVFTGNDEFPFTDSEYVDTDGDGIGNNADLDDDGDGLPDSSDDFPLDNSEQKDLDGDGIGDRSDPDIDGDGISNGDFSSGDYIDPSDPVRGGNDAFPFQMLATTDTDNDDEPNITDLNDDGDAEPDATDAFPLDPSEWLDSDNDGLGNNADSDDDNDGVLDGSDDFPLDSSEYVNTDKNHPTNSDLIGNNADTDDDGDGVLDSNDIYPLNASEQYDNDGDGVGDNADSDDDNDGFSDAVDFDDNDPLEWFDTDRDGTGNNADTDDDGDGRLDSIDLFPLDATEWLDADNDGLGDNADSDDDNDGIRDIDDAFPNNPVEAFDTDGDGLGNVFDSDDDNDGVLDFQDQLPLDANEQLDTDGDLIGNNADLDDDADGMSDEFELLHNFDPLNGDDGLLDTDFDGVSNAAEALAGSHPLRDDYAPIITPPQAVHINANHTFTQLDLQRLIALTSISVRDGLDGTNCCGLTALGFETGAKNISSGLIPILWRAVDNAGNISNVSQVLNIHPLVNFSSAQIVAEGGVARVEVVLSGEAPAYPVTLPLTITGTVDNADYTIADNKIIIEQGTKGFIDININNDFQVEGDEQLLLSFEQGVNAGVHAEHLITITEGNVAPNINLAIWQKGIQVPSVAKNDGEVTVVLSIKDSNVQDTHQIDWKIPDYLNAVLSTDKLQFVFLVDGLSLPDENKGLINFSVKVTDSGNSTNSGTEELSQTKLTSLALLTTQKTLRNIDSDRDGLNDLAEGFSDEDSDGLPAYMDNSTIPYLQPLHINAALSKLAETEPGLQLKLGKFALLRSSDGVAMSQQEIEDTGLVEKDSLKNTMGYFDFEIHNIAPFGRSVAIVLPLSAAIVEYSVYRKVNAENQWTDFVEDSNNVISTSTAVNGVCPPPHSVLYQAGLNVGDTCLKLFIEDGGANDADGLANGVIDDPGGIAVVDNTTISLDVTPEKSSSGSLSLFALFALFLLSVTRLMRTKCLTKY
jgi:Thrombospondin type 3 repeat